MEVGCRKLSQNLEQDVSSRQVANLRTRQTNVHIAESLSPAEYVYQRLITGSVSGLAIL